MYSSCSNMKTILLIIFTKKLKKNNFKINSLVAVPKIYYLSVHNQLQNFKN